MNFKSKILSAFFLLVLSFHLQAQNPTTTTISGVVVDENQQPLIGTLVSLHPAEDKENILGFTTTNAEGRWQFEIEPEKLYLLEFRFLGYKTLFVAISSKSEASVYQSLSLQPDPQLLEEIEIQAEKMAKVNGDTISYNLKAYTNGTEENLADILKKLPGLEVKEDGTVNYNGKRVQLLLNGKDILNNQHKLATDGLNATDIAEVRVLNNYKSLRDFLSREQTDAVGLEIILTDEAKAKWKGNIATSGGYKNTGNAEANLFNINDKLSATVFGRFNNTGSEVLGLMDYLSLQPSVQRKLQSNSENLNEIIPREFSFPLSLSNNRDGLFATNLDYSEKENFHAKFSLMGIHFHRESNERFERNYWLEKTFYEGEKTERSSLPMLNASLSLIFTKSKKSYLELELPYAYQDGFSKLNRIGFFDSIQTNNQNRYARSKYEFAPKLYFSQKLSERFSLLGNVSLEKHRLNNATNLQDVESLFNTDTTLIWQNYQEKKEMLHAVITLEYAVNNSTLGLKQQIFDARHEVNTAGSEAITALSQATQFEELRLATQLFYQFKNEKWILKPAITIAAIDRSQSESEKREGLFLKVEQLVRYAFLPLKSVTFHFKYQENPFGLEKSYNIVRLRDARSLEIDAIPLLEKSENLHFNLNYVNFNQITGSKTVTQISYAQSRNAVNINVLDSGNFVLYNTETIPELSKWSLSQTLSKKLESFNIMPSLRIRVSQSTSKQNSGVEVESNSQQISFDLKTIWKDRLVNLDLGIAYQQQAYDNGREAKNKFSNLMPHLNIILNAKKIRLESYSKFTQNYQNGIAVTRFLDIGFEAALSIFNNQNLKFTLKGLDLLNLDGAQSESVIYGNTFLEIVEFRRFPGYLLAGLRWRI